jgi:acetyl esterase
LNADRLTGRFVRGLAALPSPVQRVLGGSPRMIDGQRLDPEVQLLLRLLGRSSDGTPGTVAEARSTRAREARMFEGRRFAVARAQDMAIPGPAGAGRVRSRAL